MFRRAGVLSLPENNEVLMQALRWLKQRDYHSEELRARLVTKGYPKETVGTVLQFLIERRLLDDERMIQQTIEQFSGKRQVGRNLIRAKLSARNIPEVEIDRILEGIESQDDGQSLHNCIAKKREDGKNRAQIGRFLASKGFETDEIEAALDRAFGPEEAF